MGFHIGIVALIDRSCQLKILDLSRIHLQTLGNCLLKTTRNGIMNHHILPCILAMGHIIRLPSGNIHTCEFYLIFTSILFLADAEVVCCDLARKILCIDIANIMARLTINCNCQKCLASSDCLRNNNSSELIIVLHRHNTGKRGVTFRCHNARRKVDCRLSDCISHKNLLAYSSILCSISPS